MTTYSLTLNIDNAGLQNIYHAGQVVTIVKSVGNEPASVAWISFQPLETNTITWEEEYVIYGTRGEVDSGAKIVMTSQTATADTGLLYTFDNGQFSASQAGGTDGQFSVLNSQANGFTFGLAQEAKINGVATSLAPMNAVVVNDGQTASFVPIETVSVYLSSFQNNGVVISGVVSNAAVVTLTSDSSSATLGFNDKTNTFFTTAATARVRQADLALKPGSGARPKPQSLVR
jgi:hypothetical protein